MTEEQFGIIRDHIRVVVVVLVGILFLLGIGVKKINAQPDPQVVWDVELNSTLTFKPGSGSMDDSLENRSWQGPVDKVIYNDTLITFIDGADLQRQYREIASVCDTTLEVFNPDNIYKEYWAEIVRCRTNVRIAIIPEYWLDRSVTAEYSQPKALIYWEWTE